MGTLLRAPDAVLEAREAKKGLHFVLEILVFVAVFFVCTVGEVLVLLPVQTVMLMRDQEYQRAALSGDLERAMELVERVTGSDAYVIASLFVTVVMILVVALFCKLIQKRKMTSLGFVREGAAREYGKGLVFGLLLFSAAALLCVVTGSMKLSFTPEAFSLPMFLLFAVGFLFQGMAEEMLCRGYFMVSLGRRNTMAMAALVNAAAFAALHLGNPGLTPLAMVNLVLFGIFASLCFLRTGNIWLIGALHSVWNLAQGNIYGVRVSGLATSCTVFSSEMTAGRELINGGAFGLEGGLAVTAVLAAGIAALCFFQTGRSNHADKRMEVV